MQLNREYIVQMDNGKQVVGEYRGRSKRTDEGNFVIVGGMFLDIEKIRWSEPVPYNYFRYFVKYKSGDILFGCKQTKWSLNQLSAYLTKSPEYVQSFAAVTTFDIYNEWKHNNTGYDDLFNVFERMPIMR